MKHIFRIQLYMDEKFHSRSMYRLQKTTVHSQGGASQVNRPSNPPPPLPARITEATGSRTAWHRGASTWRASWRRRQRSAEQPERPRSTHLHRAPASEGRCPQSFCL